MNLNLGGGNQKIEGFSSVDLTPEADYIHDLSQMPWPFPDASCEALLASHVLEHFSRDQGARFLAECARILKPGGTLAIAVPDMDRFIDAKLTRDFRPLGGYFWTDLNHLCGGDASEQNPFMRHRYMYSWASLAWALTEVGLTPQRVGFGGSALGLVHNEAYVHISLYVDARNA